MKLVHVLSLVLVLVSARSSASGRKEFNEDEKQLLNAVFNYCPVAFIQAMGGATRVGEATFESNEKQETYEINTVIDARAPIFRTVPAATLKIVRTVVEDDKFVPDMPTQWKTDCQLSLHRNRGM